MKIFTFYRLPAILIVCVLLISFFPATVQGQATKTFTGTGNFSTAARWSGGTLPAAGDNLVIDGACTVDNSVVTDNVAYGTLVIGTATGRTLNWTASGTNRLNVSDVSAGSGASTLNMTNGGTLIIGGTLTPTNLTFISGTGTIERQLAGASMTSYSTFNNLVINTSGTISPATNLTINGNLTVTSGTFTVGAFSLAVTGTTTVTSTLTISSATGTKTFGDLTINGTFNNTAANAPITVNGDFQNNGVYNGGTARVTFTGAASNTITGTATTAFNGGITVNKGTSNTNVLDVQSVITMSAGGLTLTNGTFKLSSASTITPFTANITSSPYLIPSTAGLWCNGGTMTGAAMAWTINGLVRVSAGTLNAGAGIGDFFAPNSASSIIVEGGNFNLADRLSLSGSTWSFTMTGGTMTVAKFGSSTLDRPPFNMDMAANSFSMSGGTIIIANKGGTAGQNLGYKNLATSGSGFTGGTLQIGDATTPASSIMGITSTNPIYNLTVNSANATALITTNDLTVTNDVTIAAGILNANNLNLSVGGSWTNNASTSGFTAGTATVTMNGAIAESISGSFVTTFNNLTISAGNTVTSNVNCSVSGNLLVSSGTLNLGSFTANRASAGGTLTVSNGATLKIGGTNTFPSNYSTHSIGVTSTIEYSGTNQSIAVLNSAQDYGHLIISGSGTKTLAGAENVGGNLVLSSGTFNTNGFDHTVNGNFSNAASAVFVNSAIMSVKGNITNDQAGMSSGSGTLHLNGSAAQSINGSQPFKTFNLTTNNSAGITLNNNLSVSGVHVFVAGHIISSATPNYLIYEAGSSYSGDADSRHVNGWVKKIGSTNFSFPVGNGTVLRKLSIQNLSGVLDFNCKFNTPTPNTNNVSSPLILINQNEYWTLNRVTASGSAQVHLNWDDTKIDFPNYKLNAIRVANYLGGLWTNAGGTATGNISTTGDVTSNVTSNFGSFAFSSDDYYLPLTFIMFNVQKKEGLNRLQWETANEINTSHFEIERSINSVSFEKIGTLGTFNISTLRNYTFEDRQPPNGTIWYRIRTVDRDGKSTYSTVLSVMQGTSSKRDFYVVNNPVAENIHIYSDNSYKGEYVYQLSNTAGQVVQKGSIRINSNTVLIALSVATVKGLYFLEISNSENHFQQGIVVK